MPDTAPKLRTKRQKVKIALRAGGSLEVDAWVRKGLAVHRAIGWAWDDDTYDDGCGWTVSHTRTGSRVRTWPTLAMAREHMRLLLAYWDDWRSLHTLKAVRDSTHAKAAYGAAKDEHPHWQESW